MNSGAERQRLLCEALEITRPVLLAPMASIAGGKLASEVSLAGGLGFLGGGYGDIPWLRTELAHVPQGCRVGVGLITWHMAENALEEALALQPRAVWLSFGDPTPHLPVIAKSDALAVTQVSRVFEAEAAISAGADVIVAQGSEAGGHGRQGRSLFGLLPEIASSFPETPLVAAGSINDAQGLRAAVELGAWGVALGSALAGTLEANDTELAKAKLVDSRGDDTVQSTVFDHIRGPLWPEQYVGRSVTNELTNEWAGREAEMAPQLDELREQYEIDNDESNMSRRVLWAGEGVSAIRDIVPAREVIERFPQFDTA